MLIEITLLFIGSPWHGSDRCTCLLQRVDSLDTYAQPWLRSIDFLLRLLLVLFPLRSDFIDSLFEQDLELRLRSQFLVVLLAGCLEQPSLVLHHLAQFVHDAIVPAKFLFFRFDLANGDVDERTALLVRGSSAKASDSCHVRRATGGRRAEVRCPLIDLRGNR